MKILGWIARPKILLAFTGIIFIVFTVSLATPFIYSDGYGSFHTTQCLLKEFSWVCGEKPEYYTDHTVSYYAPLDICNTVYAPGSALINMPGQIAANFVDSLTPEARDTYSNVFAATNGHSLAQGFFFMLTASTLSLTSLVFIYKSVRNFGYNRTIAQLATAASFLSSYAIWYALLDHAYNHTTEIFALSIFTYALSRYVHVESDTSREKLKWLSIIAMSLGLAVLARPTLAVLVIFFGIYLLKELWEKSNVSISLRYLATFALAGLPFLIIYLNYNYESYRGYFASSYGLLFNQNFDLSQWFGIELLFSEFRGWFIYSPLFFFSVITILASIIGNSSAKNLDLRKFKVPRSILIIFFCAISANWLIYSFWPIWWGGGSYGQRFMISFLPFLTIGTALLMHFIFKTKSSTYRKMLLVLITILVFWSSTLTLFYRFTPVTQLRPLNDKADGMLASDRYTPKDIISYQISLVRDSSSIKDYGSNFLDSLSGGVNLPAIFFGYLNHVVRINDADKEQVLTIITEANTRKQLPEINYYLCNQKLRKLELFIWDTSKSKQIEITKIDEGNKLIKTVDLPINLNATEYKSFYLSDGNIVFLETRPTIIFKGDVNKLPHGEEEYILN